jgi:sphingomyelin phosphodiesterase 2
MVIMLIRAWMLIWSVARCVTQLYSRASEQVPLHFRAHHLVNAYEFSKLIRHAAAMGRTVIAMGDLNVVPESFPVQFVLEHTGAHDAWNATHHDETSTYNSSELTAELAIQRFGITADSPLNTYTDPHNKNPYVLEHLGKRLDYAIYRGPAPGSRHSDLMQRNVTIECVETKVMLTEPVPGTTYSYSDHFGLEATFRISTASIAGKRQPADGLPRLSEQSIDTMADALKVAHNAAISTNRFYLMVFSCCIGSLIFITIGTSRPLPKW